MGKGWDEPLPEDVFSRWEEWKGGLQKLREVMIPRCYYPHNFGDIMSTELHHFSDASNVGYGACCYVRYINSRNEIYCSLVMAKVTVAATKLTSIPRLELSAAVVSARTSAMLKTELEMKIDEEFFWTDSQVVSAYIHNDSRRFHVFVANRLEVIKEKTDLGQWYYVDTLENQADHASRGLHVSGISSTSWMSGPKFLWEQEVKPRPNFSNELQVGDPEVRAVQVNVATTTTSDSNNMLSSLSPFSSWIRLLKVVARIKRLASKRGHQGYHVTVEERERAAEVVIKLAQQQAIPQEIKTLERGGSLPCSSPHFRLDPIVDKGLLRIGGRLKQSSQSRTKAPSHPSKKLSHYQAHSVPLS